jgi:amidase
MSSRDRRDFLKRGVAALAVPALGRVSAACQEKPFELNEITLVEMQARMKSGAMTAQAVTEKYLARIEALDRAGPTLRSIIEVNPDAMAQAKAADEERKGGKERGPLHGVPVLIKDNIDTADRMATTAGSLALVGARPAKDAFVVTKLRQAGAVLLGKTNLSEWANFRCSYSTSGWSARGGLTRNPYVLDRNACGSSSGSGVAVAANLCAVAVGTETDGSIVSPASANGIVGIKPTIGLVSRSGIVPISHTQDTAGPMARCVADAAALLNVLAGADRDDPITAKQPGVDYTKSLDPAGLKGARIGVARNHFGFHDRVDAVFAEAIAAMKSAGAEIIDPAELPKQGEVSGPELTVLLYEFKADLNAYLRMLQKPGAAKTLKELIEFNDKNKEKEQPYFGQDLFVKAEAKGGLDSYEYLEALAKCRRLTRTEGIDEVMDKHKLDALIAPTIGPACPSDLVNGDHWLGGASTAAAVAGYPSINVPAGFVSGLPLGLLFFGRAWGEPTLIKLAYGFEQATKHRKPPQFLATVKV